MGWMEQDYWTTQDGRVLYPKDFEDSHLINTLKFIKRRAPAYKYHHELATLTAWQPQGDGACMALEAESIRLERMPVDRWLEYYCNIYNLLVEESNKRGLNPGKEQ